MYALASLQILHRYLQCISPTLITWLQPCSCLVWDFASRNKKRGIPRALWYVTTHLAGCIA